MNIGKNALCMSRKGTTSLRRGFILFLLLGFLVPGCAERKLFEQEPVPRYRMVAAGIVKGNGKVRPPVFNGLRVVRMQSGQLVLSFEGYRQPSQGDTHTYVLNAMPVAKDEMILPVAALEDFTPDGIVLLITDPEGRMRLPLRFLVEMEFVVEIGEVDARPL